VDYRLFGRAPRGATSALTSAVASEGVADSTDRTGIRVRKAFGFAFWAALFWIGLVLVSALLADWLPIASPTDVAPLDRLAPIGTPGHPLGTDDLGRDILSRMIYGARVSVIVSLASVLLGAGIGVPSGMLAGYWRGKNETAVMFVADVILSFPALILLLALVSFVGQSLGVVAVILGLLAIPTYTRIARANTLATTNRSFVVAARALGARDPRILIHEILPNVLPPLMAYGLIAMGVVIVVEGSLSFLGLSVQAPTPSWGGLIAQGQHYLEDAPHLVLIPSAAMLLTVLALNFMGDAVRQAYDLREARV
jgi:peptide/nickel transport system permease protein